MPHAYQAPQDLFGAPSTMDMSPGRRHPPSHVPTEVLPQPLSPRTGRASVLKEGEETPLYEMLSSEPLQVMTMSIHSFPNAPPPQKAVRHLQKSSVSVQKQPMFIRFQPFSKEISGPKRMLMMLSSVLGTGNTKAAISSSSSSLLPLLTSTDSSSAASSELISPPARPCRELLG